MMNRTESGGETEREDRFKKPLVYLASMLVLHHSEDNFQFHDQ